MSLSRTGKLLQYVNYRKFKPVVLLHLSLTMPLYFCMSPATLMVVTFQVLLLLPQQLFCACANPCRHASYAY